MLSLFLISSHLHSKDIFIKCQWYGHYLHYTYRDLYLPCWLCLFAMHPGGFREGTGSVTGCGRHHPQHSPACTDVFRTNVYRRDSSASQWEAVVEVSLFSYSIFARLLARDCTCNTVYAVFMVQTGISQYPFINQDILLRLVRDFYWFSKNVLSLRKPRRRLSLTLSLVIPSARPISAWLIPSK